MSACPKVLMSPVGISFKRNDVNIFSVGKMRRIYDSFIGFIEPLLTLLFKTFTNSQIRCRSILTLVSLSLFRWSSLSFVASSWLSCRRFKALSLVEIYP